MPDKLAEKTTRVGFVCAAADVFQPPVERKGAAIWLGGPALMLITANFLLEIAQQ